MNKFIQENFTKLRNIGKLTNQGEPKKNEGNETLELVSIDNDAGPSATSLQMKTRTIFNCENVQKAANLFDFGEIKNEIEDHETALLLKVQIADIYDDIDSEVLEYLSIKCRNKSIVIFLISKNCEKISIYWKSKDIEQFIILRHYGEEFTENDVKIYEFVADYLAKSLSKGELGLYREWQQYSNGIEVPTQLLADSRDYNLIMIAAEAGNTEVVKILLDFGADTVAEDGASAQSLAWKNRHSDVLLVLTQSNLTYPEGIDISQLSTEFKTFYKKTEELHEAINTKSEEKVKEILNRGENLEFFFDLSNKSAARAAIDAKAFDIYEILVMHEIFLAPHEYQEGVFEDLEDSEQEHIRELHNKHSKDLPDKHINVLMAHSFVSHDVPDAQGKLKYVYNAYKHLSQDPRLSTILKVVAASKKLRIIYDFNRDAVNIADPTMAQNTEGVFYTHGRIYIGAKQLLDDATRCQAVATLAHELCHYAANIVYSNVARPYKNNDNQTMQEFEEINEKCQKEQGKEEIVDLVYECYPTDMHHAELIVRPAHMIAMYMDQPEKLAEVGKIFPELFEFFIRIIKEMEAAIPEIERRDEDILEKKDEKISRLRKKLVLSAIFSVIGIIIVAAVVALIFYKPFYSFKELSANDKIIVKNGRITYKNVEVRFRDLFPENSTAYEKLTSDHISQIFDGHPLNFSDSHFLYLNNFVRHDWQNLTENLKQKFLTSNFTFQNESLKLEKLKEINSEVFNSLTSEQIVDVLNGKELVVGHMIENKTEFYLERKLIFEDIKAGYIFMDFLQNFKNKTIKDLFDRYPAYKGFFSGGPYGALLAIENLPVSSFTLQDIYGVVSLLDFNVYTGVIKEIERHGFIKDYDQFLEDLNSDKLEFIHHDFDKIFQVAQNSKIFILSSEAGAGKTVTFEQLAMRIKKKFPTRWVSYIDMKEYVDLYGKFGDPQTLLVHILRLESKSDFERKIFESLYDSGNAVLLWNGFDEISPDYNQFIVDLLSQVRQTTHNIQFVSTRPLYSLQLRDSFKTRTFQLIPYSKAQQEEFLTKFFNSKKVEKSKISGNIKKIRKTIKSLGVGGVTSEAKETTRDFNTPLMLKLVAEIYVDDDKVDSDNFYEIYQKFVEKKVGVWQKSSPQVQTVINTLLSASSKFNIIEIYHKYALPIELYEALHLQIIFELKKLKVMSREIPKQLPKTEISRMGILYINDDTKYEFAHKTLGEFFTAQYFIENVYNADDDVGSDEAYYRLEIFFYIAQNYGYNQVMVTDFMKSFLEIGHSGRVEGISGKNGTSMGTLRLDGEDEQNLNQNGEILRLSGENKQNLTMNEEIFFLNSESKDILLSRYGANVSSLVTNATKNDNQEYQNDPQKEDILPLNNEPSFENKANSHLSPQNDPQIKRHTRQSDSNKPFSLEMSKLLRTTFKKFLFDLVNPRYPDILKFLLDFFRKDHEILLELLCVNEDETLYTAAFNPNYFVALVNPVQIKEIVRGYLSEKEFKRFLSGRNQKGKIVLGLLYYEQKNKPKIHDEYSPKSINDEYLSQNSSAFEDNLKIQENVEITSDPQISNPNTTTDYSEDTDFYDYSEIISKNLTDPEKKEFFLLAISPAFYSAFDVSKLPKHEKFWSNFQNLLTKSEIQSAIAEVIHKLIRKYPEFDEFQGPANFLPFLLQKAEELLTSSEIFGMLLNKDILHIATYNPSAFEILWEFVKNHTNEEQQKEILQKGDKPQYYKKYDSYHFYHNIPLKIIHKASLRGQENIFHTVKKIYNQYFSTKEFQEIVTSPDEFMIEFVIIWKYKSFGTFKPYFGDLFSNDEKALKKFLGRKMKITKMTIFDYFKDIRGEYFERLKEFHDFYGESDDEYDY